MPNTHATAGPLVATRSEDVFEQARLAALHRFGVLDTAAEVGFDELTALAGQLCGTPMALVSLVDADRQWFKSRVGLDVCETSREVSFCAHALAGPDVLVVKDALEDPRFADNPLVTGEPWIRFYAGAPLVTSQGHVVGTLCVLDTAPRVLDGRQLAQLGMLARQVISQLELRRQAQELVGEIAARTMTETALRENQRLLGAILEHTDVLVYAKDLDGRYLLANPALRRVLADGGPEVLGSTADDLFAPDVAQASARHDADAARSGTRQVVSEQLMHADATMHGYLTTRFPLYDDTGRVYAVAGVSTDVTELAGARRAHAESEQRWRALVEHSPVAVAVIGADGRFAYANPKALELYGADTLEELMQRPASELVPDGAAAATSALFGSLLHGGPPLVGHRWTLLRLDGATVPVEVNAAAVTHRGLPAVQVELRDVTEQAKAEAALRESERRFRALFACSPVGTAECLPDGTMLEANPQMCQMLGYEADELVGRPVSGLLADPAEAQRQNADMASLQHGSGYFAERVYRRKDDSVLPVLVGVGVVRDDAGEVQRLLGTVLDVSDRVAAEEALRAAHDELAARTAFTEAVLDSIDVGVVACDADGHLTVFNHATKAWHGIDLAAHPEDAADPLGYADAFALHDADGQLLDPDQVPLLRALNEGSVRGAEMVISPHDLPATRVLCSGRALTAPDGRPLGAVVAMTDITAARASTRALQASEQRFRTTFTNDPAGLAVLSQIGRALQVNPALCRLIGRDEAELLGLPDLLCLVVEADRSELVRLTRQALVTPGASLSAERRLLRADGVQVWASFTVTELPDADQGSSVLVQVEDITARRAAEQLLTHQALYDNLTDLPNRAMLLDHTTRALARLVRRPDDGLLAMLFCDLDGFKAVNDTHGHAAGDHLLVEVARRLSAAMRPTDTVSRLGGDEFVVLCENLPNDEEMVRIARRLELAIAAPVPYRDQVLAVTASIGIARGHATLTAPDLVRNADTAMFAAKRRGKDQFVVYDDQRDPGPGPAPSSRTVTGCESS